ncbi:hypothetical protein GCM10022420_048080 [Streptomyces iranensis]|uniref:Uncharacterized protein n=1 Tax=Streptomyces iranensis TaxID=576784 RepID=A0ABS4N1A3_9ACTN|nr:hypothetical protein [Streptomyces iranensis]
MLRYRVEIAGEGPVDGQVVRVVLGHHDARNPRLALRCLRGHALHIAEGLDPNPEASWLGSVRMQRVGDDLPDVPAFFRTWCNDEGQQETAMAQLAAGRPFRLSAADHTGHYSLTVWPVHLPPPHENTLGATATNPICPRSGHRRRRKPRHAARKARWWPGRVSGPVSAV